MAKKSNSVHCEQQQQQQQQQKVTCLSILTQKQIGELRKRKKYYTIE